MIYLPESIILMSAGFKTQTRRPVQPWERFRQSVEWETLKKPVPCVTVHSVHMARPGKTILKWKVGKTYAACPGRGKHQLGRTLLKSLQCERVRDISAKDAMAEGIRWDDDGVARYGSRVIHDAGTLTDAYLKLWKSMYPKSDLTELVWVLSFQWVKS